MTIKTNEEDYLWRNKKKKELIEHENDVFLSAFCH